MLGRLHVGQLPDDLAFDSKQKTFQITKTFSFVANMMTMCFETVADTSQNIAGVNLGWQHAPTLYFNPKNVVAHT